MRHILTATIALAGIGIFGIAAAENPPQPGKPQAGNFPSPEQIKQKLMAQFDANRDGRLSEQEQMQAQEFLRRQGITLPGFGPGGGFPGAAEFLKRFDANGDGQLSDQEKFAAQAAFQKMRQQGGAGGGFGQGGFPAGGVEGNAPAPGPGADGREAKPDKRSALVKRFDKDGDGKLSAEEKAEAQAELKKGKTKPKVKTEKPATEKAKEAAEKP